MQDITPSTRDPRRQPKPRISAYGRPEGVVIKPQRPPVIISDVAQRPRRVTKAHDELANAVLLQEERVHTEGAPPINFAMEGIFVDRSAKSQEPQATKLELPEFQPAIDELPPVRAEVETVAAQPTEQASKPDKEKKRRGKLRPVVSTLLIAVILGVTGYVAYDTWSTNNQVKAELSAGSSNTDTPEGRQVAEGRDETEISTSSLANYTVAANLPRALYIDKLGVKARILPMEVNPDGSMQAPLNIFDAGWYTGSAKPGEVGAAVIDGHASGPTREGLFAYLDTLVAGDTLSIERGDGTRLAYRVIHTETVDLDKIDMKKLLLPYGSATEGINFITCAGSWLKDQKTFNQRAIVYTERVQGQ